MQKWVLYILADRHNADTDECIYKLKNIAEQAGLSIRAVRNHLRKLEQQGLIRSTSRVLPRSAGAKGGESSGQIANLYHLNLASVPSRAEKTGPLSRTG